MPNSFQMYAVGEIMDTDEDLSAVAEFAVTVVSASIARLCPAYSSSKMHVSTPTIEESSGTLKARTARQRSRVVSLTYFLRTDIDSIEYHWLQRR
jgi:hypothetical protein